MGEMGGKRHVSPLINQIRLHRNFIDDFILRGFMNILNQNGKSLFRQCYLKLITMLQEILYQVDLPLKVASLTWLPCPSIFLNSVELFSSFI